MNRRGTAELNVSACQRTVLTGCLCPGWYIAIERST
jgi:hypothetical protein